MTTLDLLTIPTLDKSQQYKKMIHTQQNRRAQEIKRIQTVSALMSQRESKSDKDE